jgi:hypothetical protein
VAFSVKKVKEKNTPTIGYLKIFAAFFLFCIIISLIFKMVQLANSSIFDSRYFTVLLIGKKVHVVNFQDGGQGISVIEIKTDRVREIEKMTRVKASIRLGIPLDAIIKDNKDNPHIHPKEFFTLENTVMGFFGSRYTTDNINKLDIFKIYLATYSVSLFDVNAYTIDENDKDSGDVSEFLRDKDVINEKVSIQVINASTVSGAAGKITRMLENGGFAVISILSQDQDEEVSRIECKTSKIVAIERMKRIFPNDFACTQEAGIADMTIIIGRDGEFIDTVE